MNKVKEYPSQAEVYIGIDNGLDGAIAAIYHGTNAVVLEAMPTIKAGSKRLYDVNAVVKTLTHLSLDIYCFAVLEKAQAMPKQGVSSMFSLGTGYGIMQGVLAALGISYQIAHPRRWQSALCGDLPGTTKERALAACKRLFPEIDLRATERARKPHKGIVDALLIAEYARRIGGKTE